MPPARNRRTSKGCPGVVLRATRGDRNNIPYTLLVLAIIATFPFYLLTLLEARDSIGPIFSFFLEDLLEAFLALCFY